MAALISFPAWAADNGWLARGKGGMVATDAGEASQIGATVLAEGGNAFDAAVATSLALAVCRPQSTGLGGGGFLVAYVAKEQRFVVLDFREVAPAGAIAEHYAKLMGGRGAGPSPSIYGGNAAGVPGQAAGLAEIHKRFATKPWRDLVEPARRLAENGFTVDEAYREACEEALADYRKWPQLQEQYATLHRTLLGSGTAPASGARLARPDLARGLALLAGRGAEAVYAGPLGAAMVKAVQAAGGVLTHEDLAAYQVREREPLRGTYRGHEIVTMPPPSSGGVCLIQTLNILDEIRQPGTLRTSTQTTAVLYPVALVTALQHAFADRARWLGDPDFADVPVALLTSRRYASRLAVSRPKSADEFGSTRLPDSSGRPPGQSTRPADEPAATSPPDDRGTSHFCVADSEGNIVALTETINGVFGALVVAEPYGIILNNQMDDFTTEPGKPNLFGLIQSERNAVAPGKRPLSSMAPTIVLKDGRPVLALGASGGPRIITSVLQVLLNVVDFNQPLAEALPALRLHHQWQPNEVYFDRQPPRKMIQILTDAGHKVSGECRTGIVQAIQFLPDGTLVGGSDPRKGGRPAGVP